MSTYNAPLDEEQVRDLLFGDTDPREVALFLAQYPNMDDTVRRQRLTIIDALVAHSNRRISASTAELARETADLARQTARLATYARWSFGAALVALVVSIIALA